MPGTQQRTYTNFSGGQNNYSGPQAAPIIVDNGIEALAFAEMSFNWEMAENGLIKYAGDIEALNSAISGTPVLTGLYDWNGTQVACAGGKVYTVGGGTATQIYTGHTAGKYYQFTEWDDGTGTEILILCNGYDKPLYYDGTTCTTIAFTDDASVIWDDARPKGAAVFRNRIFYWGDPDHPHRIYTPQPGSYNNFNNINSDVDAFDVDAGFGGVITGLKALTDDLMAIYKQRVIRRLSGSNPFGSSFDVFEIRPVSDDVGCIAPRTLVQVGVQQYFLAEDGYRRLKPVQEFGDIDPQQPTYPIQGIMDGLNYSESVISEACAVYHKPTKQIWLSVPDGSSNTNNLVIIHDTVTGGNDPRQAGDIAASVLATFNRKVYAGNYAGQIYKHGDDYTYHGDAIDSQWESKYIAHDGLGRRKIYREMHIFAESDGAGSIVIQWQTLQRADQRAGSSTQQISSGDSSWDTALWDVAVWGEGQQQVFKIKNLGRGNAIKLRFVNNASNQNVKIRQVDLFYDLCGTIRG